MSQDYDGVYPIGMGNDQGGELRRSWLLRLSCEQVRSAPANGVWYRFTPLRLSSTSPIWTLHLPQRALHSRRTPVPNDVTDHHCRQQVRQYGRRQDQHADVPQPACECDQQCSWPPQIAQLQRRWRIDAQIVDALPGRRVDNGAYRDGFREQGDLMSTARRQGAGMNRELVFSSGRIVLQPELVALGWAVAATPVQ